MPLSSSLTSTLPLFENSKAVIYIETNYNIEINLYIQENYRKIVADFADNHIDFLYLPCLLQDPAYRRIFEYNYPFLSDKLDNIAIADIYKAIGRKYLLISDETNTISLRPYAKPYEPLNGSILISLDTFTNEMKSSWRIDVSISISEQFTVFLREFHKKYTSLFEVMYPSPESLEHIQFQRIIPPEPKKRLFRLAKQKENEEFELEAEILERINQLKERGSLKLIGKIIDELQKANQHISPLFITNDYRIFLKDYGMKEAMMPPLSKSLYILYLRHHEGIRFKKLSKHYNELLSIYRNVTVHDDVDAAIESIKAMTDPLNNSVNEKCSRIRAAFLELITDDLAKNYYITGPRGESKKITLDRSLVEYQK
jgi:hypothetical protein